MNKLVKKPYISKSPQQTINYGLSLAKLFKGGDVILLKGGLGSGKTTFIKGVALYFGITATIQSPTFVLFKPYKILKHARSSRASTLYHADVYRLKSRLEVAEAGFSEILLNKRGILFIENPKSFFINKFIKYVISFNILKNNFHKISLYIHQ